METKKRNSNHRLWMDKEPFYIYMPCELKILFNTSICMSKYTSIYDNILSQKKDKPGLLELGLMDNIPIRSSCNPHL